MRFKGILIGPASGSIAGTTFSRNAGGQYIRQRSIPTDPATAPQMEIRSFVSSLVNVWANTLTQVQRDAWNVYAANVPLNDVFGDPRFRTGINHYVRSNVPRLQVGLARVDTGPTIFDLGEFTAPNLTITPATSSFNVDFDDTDDWVGEDDAAMLLWGSKPKNPSVNFFKGPYTSMDSIFGDGTLPPTTPVAVPEPFVYVVGQKGFLRVNVSRADGRLSTPFLVGVLAT